MTYLNENTIPNHNYFHYKQPFLGSYKKMRFRVVCELPKEEGQDKRYLATTYPDLFCFEKTPEEEKCSQYFPFTLEGRIEVIDWLDKKYEDYM